MGLISVDGYEPAHLSFSTVSGYRMCDFILRGHLHSNLVTRCWVWGRAVSSSGYGTAWNKGSRTVESAHRLAWKIATEDDVPDGAVVMHSCDNKLCVNPEHLSLGSYSQNILDAIARGLAAPGSYNAVKTHCRAGHPYSGDNLHVRANGHRVCRTCNAGYGKAA